MAPKNTVFLRWIIFCLLMMPANTVFAAGSMSLGAANSYNYDSNVFKSSTIIQSSEYYLVAPRADVSWDISKLSFRTGYAGAFSFYPNVPQNDYQDKTGFGSFAWKADDRHGFELKARYSSAHLPRDSIQSGASPNTPFDFGKYVSLSGEAIFPLPEERYDLQLQAGISDNVYTGANAEKQNKYIGNAMAELLYRYSGKTSLVYGYKANGNRVKSDLYRELDDFSQALFVGARWLTTGKTTSHALIGYENIRLNRPESTSFGGLHIDISAIWQRKSYSKVTLSALRSSQDSLLYGLGFIVVSRLDLNLLHNLTDRWSVDLGSSIYAFEALDEYRHLGGYMNIGTRYSTRWISVGVKSGYQYRYSLKNDSSGFYGYTASAEIIVAI